MSNIFKLLIKKRVYLNQTKKVQTYISPTYSVINKVFMILEKRSFFLKKIIKIDRFISNKLVNYVLKHDF